MITFDPHDSEMVAIACNRKLHIMYWRTCNIEFTFPHRDMVRSVQYHPTVSKIVCTASDDQKVRIIDVASGSVLHEIVVDADGPLCDTAFDPNGFLIASAGLVGLLRVFQVFADKTEFEHPSFTFHLDPVFWLD